MAEFVADTVPRARMMLFKNSGHMPFYEEADKFNKAVREFSKTP